MSFASFVDDIAEAINKGIRGVADSGVIPKAVGKVTRTGLDVGKAAGNVGFKVGTGAINKALDGANFLKDNKDAIIGGAKAIGKSVALEANEFAQAGIGVAGTVDKLFLKSATLDRSIIGRKFNAAGLTLIAAGATAMQGGKDVKQYLDSRQGQNDGQLYRPTTQISTPYQLSEQMAYGSHGRSFANNAGATGDLVFALNDMRHG